MDELIMERFKQINREGFKNQGKIEQADVVADGEGCRGSGDHLFLYLKIEEGRIVNIKYKCAYCDPAMFVTAEILCDRVRGLSINEIPKIDKKDFSNFLGEYSQEVIEHSTPALEILRKAIENYKDNI